MTFSALARLQRLRSEPLTARQSDSTSGGICRNFEGLDLTVGDLPPDWRIEWEERAAIREFDAGQVREHAEAEAFGEIVARMRAADRYEAR